MYIGESRVLYPRVDCETLLEMETRDIGVASGWFVWYI